MAGQRRELGGVVRVEVARVADGGPVHEVGRCRVAQQAVGAGGVLEDAVRDGEMPDYAACRQAGGHEVVAQPLDVGGLDRRYGPLAPARLEVAADAQAVILDGRELAPLDMLDVVQVAGGGVGERGAAGLVIVGTVTDGAALGGEQVRERIFSLLARQLAGSRLASGEVGGR